MNWEQEVYIDHNRVKLNMEKGYKYLVRERDPKPYDVDDDRDDYLYSMLADNMEDVKSFFHVGFSMGRTLINTTRLRPDLRVGGITWFDNSVAFGQQLFNLTDHGELELQVGEYPYKPIVGSWDFIYLGRLPHKSNLGREILAKACEDTNKYVFLFANAGDLTTFPDDFECVHDFDSGLEFVPVLLTRKNPKLSSDFRDVKKHVMFPHDDSIKINDNFDIDPSVTDGAELPDNLVDYDAGKDEELMKDWEDLEGDPIPNKFFPEEDEVDDIDG